MNSLRKYPISIFAVLLALTSSATADDCCIEMTDDCCTEICESKLKGLYLGGFGGWGYSSAHDIQKGTAFYPASKGGPLAVDASGSSKESEFGFGGLHIGYERAWREACNWNFSSGGELEGFYFSDTKKSILINPTDRFDLHQFTDKFPMKVWVMLANGTLAFNNDYISPYIGVGVGAAHVYIHHASSTQTVPPELGVNHFNSNPNATDWAFAVQAKGGLRYQIHKHVRIFGEYRFLYLHKTDYTFGPTVYPTHVRTTKWSVDFSNIHYNLFALGIDFTW